MSNIYEEQVNNLYKTAEDVHRVIEDVSCGSVPCGSCPFSIFNNICDDWDCMGDMLSETVERFNNAS